MNMVLVIAVAAFGLIIGSFLNVVIYRVPRRESVVFPSSHCPACEHSLAVKDNIPILSYLLLRGKCRYCGAPISLQYPLVEVMTAVLVIIALFKFGFGPVFGMAVFFSLVLLTVTVIDINDKIIPNIIIVPAIVVSAAIPLLYALIGTSSLSLIDKAYWAWPLVGFVLGGGSLFLLALLWPNGMGGGDIKLAAFMGLFLGRYIVVALFIGFLLGSIGGITAMSFFGKGRKDLIPFGPYLAAGSLITIYFGVPLAKWYLGLAGWM